jgi:hypothetical protein
MRSAVGIPRLQAWEDVKSLFQGARRAGSKVIVAARDAQRLAEVEQRLGVAGTIGDVADRALAVSLLHEFRLTVG